MSGGECHTTLRVSMAVSATPFKWSAADYTFLPKILEQMSKQLFSGLRNFSASWSSMVFFTLEKDINPNELFVNKNSSRLWRAI